MKKITFVFSSFFLLSSFLLPAEVLSSLGIYAKCGEYNVLEFDDVNSSYPYYEDICFLKKNRWAEGKTVIEDDKEMNKFIPNDSLTRAEFAKMITTAYYNQNKTKDSKSLDVELKNAVQKFSC